jgi:hypothetical protein
VSRDQPIAALLSGRSREASREIRGMRASLSAHSVTASPEFLEIFPIEINRVTHRRLLPHRRAIKHRQALTHAARRRGTGTPPRRCMPCRARRHRATPGAPARRSAEVQLRPAPTPDHGDVAPGMPRSAPVPVRAVDRLRLCSSRYRISRACALLAGDRVTLARAYWTENCHCASPIQSHTSLSNPHQKPAAATCEPASATRRATTAMSRWTTAPTAGGDQQDQTGKENLSGCGTWCIERDQRAGPLICRAHIWRREMVCMVCMVCMV